MKNLFQPKLDTSRTQSRNLVFCFDGTWNDPSDMYEKGGDITNILKLHRCLKEDESRQLSFYFEGVGTGESKWDKYVGGITGKGAKAIRNQAYVKLVTNYKYGDKIYVFGFSRGAAIARMFCNLLQKKGIPEVIEYRKKKFKAKGKQQDVSVTMLGCFDTVASFGIPVDIGIPFQQVDLFTDLTLSSSVKKAYHLVSVHDGRRAFFPTLMNRNNHVEEIWFPGVHADVGGGFSDRGISDISLKFMIDRAKEQGMLFDENKVAEIRPNITGLIHDLVKEEFALKLEFRAIQVMENNAPCDHPPKIHHTVFERLKRLGENIPPHLERVKDKCEVVGPEYVGKA